MLVLTSTDTLEIKLAGAHTTNALPIVASWRDITTSAYTPSPTVINTNGTTPVAAVAAPAASTQRVIDFVSVYNADTVAHTVTVQLDRSATDYVLTAVVLGVGERLEFAEGSGWRVMAAGSGAVKTSLNQGTAAAGTGRQMAVLASDVVNNNATANSIADVTGLSFPVVAGTRYRFRFVVQYNAAATTTGSRWTINGPAFSELAYRSDYSLTATSRTFNEPSNYNVPTGCNATTAATTGNLAVIEGIIVPSANGDVIARFASEVANSAITAKAGSFVEYEAVA